MGLIVKYMLNYQAHLDLAFQALADPARRAIVERLTRGPASVSELAKPLPMSLPAVMLHLKVLEESGLVKSEKVGRVRTCSHRAADAVPGGTLDRRAPPDVGTQSGPAGRISGSDQTGA